MPVRDANLIANGAVIGSDLCIIGAGAAGLSIALQFVNKRIDVCLLESGSETYHEDTQSLYRGDNLSTFPRYRLDQVRMRLLGGTTNVWSGNCRPLDPWDFQRRPWIPYSGWPISRSELNPYYRRAHEICELGPFIYESAEWADRTSQPTLPLKSNRVDTTIFQLSKPTNFGVKYGSAVSNAANISVLLNSTVLNLEANDTGQNVRQANVATLSGSRFSVSAKAFILAAGGIENPRLLLLSDSVNPAGLGNDRDCVGRFFMEHAEAVSGEIISADPYRNWRLYELKQQTDSTRVRGALVVNGKTLRQQEMGGFMLKFVPPQVSDGVESADYLMSGLRDGTQLDELSTHMSNVLADLDGVAISIYEKLIKSGQVSVSFRTQTEQVPSRSNRISLSPDRDGIGQRRVQLKSRLGELDLYTIRRGIEIVAQEIARAGIGRLRSNSSAMDDNDLELMQQGLHHHLGTTRMHVNPGEGVVDADCRVHGIRNLFIAGGSVFPTGGTSNPTLTIVALALRLSDHVDELVRTEFSG